MILSNLARILAVSGCLGLMLSLLAWHLWLIPASIAWPVLLLCLPLALALPGLLRGKAYTYGWCSLLVMLYLAYLLTEFLATSARPAVAPALFAAALMFAGCSSFGRLRARETPAPHPHND